MDSRGLLQKPKEVYIECSKEDQQLVLVNNSFIEPPKYVDIVKPIGYPYIIQLTYIRKTLYAWQERGCLLFKYAGKNHTELTMQSSRLIYNCIVNDYSCSIAIWGSGHTLA